MKIAIPDHIFLDPDTEYVLSIYHKGRKIWSAGNEYINFQSRTFELDCQEKVDELMFFLEQLHPYEQFLIKVNTK